MDARPFPLRSAMRWSLAGCCAALLWVAGYFGGRDAGFDAGRLEGRVAGREEGRDEGYAAGRVEGVRQAMFQHTAFGEYRHVYDVGELINERLGEAPAAKPDEECVRQELQHLVDEIVAEMDPNHDTSFPRFEIRAFPSTRLLVVHGYSSAHAEVAVYLKSRDDYLAWKRSQQKP